MSSEINAVRQMAKVCAMRWYEILRQEISNPATLGIGKVNDIYHVIESDMEALKVLEEMAEGRGG